MGTATYLVALGSNRRSRWGSPERTVAAALDAIGGVIAASPLLGTPAMGPSSRRFVNAVALVESAEEPPAMLERLKRIERGFGRRPGRRWGARVIDLDLIGWSGGTWAGPGLVVPHPSFRERRFVLAPLAAVAPRWRDPVTGRTARQLLALVDRRRPRS
ncbi:2-amino-4-hydroxy-6-hydroxymethyldihydropteridine diphosphokinase [Sphingomonas lenta]|uniref:2-amino-4-hydroxy-6-hydroxymethyldihydropteridine pyrophosphokinase n=1 Tax=Sphingomonas lenta TaxID=1141887 RepID=A0A2A2SEH8_9SPHN|nr:2-amino-4-hydroxy-6-hydroxymethyldihydropteridine diphosphokinase [Sphingomonas lenta]PAX07649.1 2-amino-4-hydroxy-6-hydroxymethyldihydropteridine diphosphokinase [Sphingomonas lenta]